MKVIELRKAFGESLVKVGEENKKVVVLDADVACATYTKLFAEHFPERFFQIGIAEQNMMGAAAGLATCGFIPFATCFAVFASKRAHDQVSISIAYPNLNVKIIGCYAGLSTPNTGATHQSTDDISTMRAIPNIRIIVPGDPIELEKAIHVSVIEDGPFYIRVSRSPAVPRIFNDDYKFELGKAVTLRDGSDITLIGTGIMTSRCLDAANILSHNKINACVLHIPTIKPIDKMAIISAAKKTKTLVTVENHSIIGGLGSAVSEVLVEKSPCRLKRIGIMDRFGESAGKVEDLFEKNGLTGKNIADEAKNILKNI